MRIAMQGMDGKGLPGPVQYLNTHGTGTPVGDSKEMEAVRSVFGDSSPLISSTKALTGHSLGAAGAQEAGLLHPDDAERLRGRGARNIDEIDPRLRRPAHRPRARGQGRGQ